MQLVPLKSFKICPRFLGTLFVTDHLKSAGLNLATLGSPSASGSTTGASISLPSSSRTFAFFSSTTFS
jgi:hypothetical protein